MTQDSIPSNVDAEKFVLGSMILKPEIIDRVVAWVRYPDSFWRVTHKRIFTCLLKMVKQGIPIDAVTLYNYYKDTFSEDISQTIVELTSLAKGSNIENLDHYSKIIWQRFIERRALEISRKMEVVSKRGGEKLEILLTQYRKWLDELENLQPSKSKDFGTILDGALNNIVNGANIIEFGLSFMDDATGGMTRGELSTLGGRPGHGKTTLMLNVVDSLCKKGYRVMVFNREMTNTEALKKLIVLSSDLTLNELRNKVVSDNVIEKLESIKDELKEKYKNVIMYDEIVDLDEAIREIRKERPDVFIDDYIQLVRVNGRRTERRFEIEDIMQEYRWVAKQTQSAGFLISQLNRDIDKRLDPIPSLSDYAEGSSIEQVSESCYFVYYGYYHNPEEYPINRIDIIVKKARYGRIGTYQLNFAGERCKIWE